ncbi:MAG: PaaI family thioesterase [Solirubrobacteraceae bacterium]|nr:PaaI family thioesterase [Solirubrobacteraceae bacterium]
MSEEALRIHRRGCWGCGGDPPGGLGLTLARRDDHVLVRGTLAGHHGGMPGAAHGGVVATILDEALGTVTARVLDRPGVTGTLTVEFLRPAPTHAPLVAEAWLRETTGRKMLLDGELRGPGGEVAARAHAIFFEAPPEHYRGRREGDRVPPPPAELPPPAAGEIAVAPHGPRCFGCGAQNEHGLRIDHARDGEEVVGRVTPSATFEGGPGVIHGGLVAAIVDDALGTVPIVLAEQLAATRTLSVRFERFVRAGTPLVARSTLVAREGRRFEAASTLSDGDGPVATGTATLVAIDGPVPASSEVQ